MVDTKLDVGPRVHGIFKLLPELRDMIWCLVVVEDITYGACEHRIRTPGILRTSHAIRREALGFWLSHSSITVRVMNFNGAFFYLNVLPNLATVSASAVRIGAIQKKVNMRTSINYCGLPSWSNLLATMKAFRAKAVRRGRIKSEGQQEGEAPAIAQVHIRALTIVTTMLGKEWGEVDSALEVLHQTVAAQNPAWY
ncbi:hypothetical protein LTR53_014755 [Teratosphaeriaceae sp. CCFEE 6253]|nr:hypothetical protein LTR53_014755 [Teratosphaeriaceae sp. CCFEE 6253]